MSGQSPMMVPEIHDLPVPPADRRGALRLGAFRSLATSRRRLVIPLAISTSIRGIVFLSATVLAHWLVLAHGTAGGYTGGIALWARKDTIWYIHIAKHGYRYLQHGQSSVNFFPLFPLLMTLLSGPLRLLLGSSTFLVSGMLISWAAFCAASVFLYQLVLRRFDARTAGWTVGLLGLFPFSFYFGAAYTESLYLLLGVVTFCAIERQSWWVAGLAAALAGALRPPGLVLGACVVLAYGLNWLRTRHRLRHDVVVLLLTPTGALTYIIYCQIRFGNALAYIHASRTGWHGGYLQLNGLLYIRHMLSNPAGWLMPPDLMRSVYMLYVLLLIPFLFSLPLTVKYLGSPYALFASASILAPILDFPTVNSLGRYLSVVFPSFIVFAYVMRSRPRLMARIAAISLCALVFFAACFIAGFGLS